VSSEHIRYIVKAHTVPVRVLRLRELVDELSGKLKTAKVLIAFELVGTKSSTWTTIARSDVIATLWRKYVEEHVRGLLVEFAKRCFGDDFLEKLSRTFELAVRGDEASLHVLYAYLTGLADIISYMLRFPLYRDPLAIVFGEKASGLYAPHQALLIARLSAAIEAVQKRESLAKILFPEKRRAKIYDVIDVFMGREASVTLETVLRVAFNIASSREVSTMLEMLFYLLPADTRPGPNTSSLLLHLLMVSAAASSLAMSRLGVEAWKWLDVPILRLAGLLHDIGKPLDPVKHVKSSVEEAKRLLEGLIPPELLDVLIGLVRAHHSERLPEDSRVVDQYVGKLFRLGAEEMHSILRCADHMMTGIDRVSRLVSAIVEGRLDGVAPEHLKEVLVEARKALEELGGMLQREGIGAATPREALEKLYSGSEHAKGVYARILSSREGVEIVARVSELLAKLLSMPRTRMFESELEKILASEWPPRSCKLCFADEIPIGLAVVDIGGIQAGLSESFKLRSLSGFSILVDYVTLALAPYAITLYGSPPEALVFAGGGTIHAIVPLQEKVEDVEKKIRGYICEVVGARPEYRLALTGISVRVGVGRFTSPLYTRVVEEAYARAFRASLQPAKADRDVEKKMYGFVSTLVSSLARPCDSCGRRPAVVSYYSDRLCLVCAARYRISDLLGYSVGDVKSGREGIRVKLLKVAGLWDSLHVEQKYVSATGFDVLEAIAEGCGCISSTNYAVLKCDGNVMGLFMASSLTATMYFERSVRIDLATKNALNRLMGYLAGKIVGQKSGREARWASGLLSAFVLGFMYAGGDDVLLILPAKIALPVAAFLAYEFSAETGFSASLSVGVAAAPTKHNIWWCLEAATVLLDEVAKKEARRPAIEALKKASVVEPVGFIAFDYSDGWGLNGSRAKTRHEEMQRDGVTIQPLPVLAWQGRPGLLDMLLALLKGDVVVVLPKDSEGDRSVERALYEVIDAFALGEAEVYAKSVYARVARAISRAVAGFGEWRKNLDWMALSLLDLLATAEDERLKRVIDLLLKVYSSNRSGKVLPLADLYLVYKYARGD